MSQECVCQANPDAVDKINFKCVECKRDLKTAIETVVAEKKAAAAERTAAAKATKAGELTEQQKADRRGM